MEATERLRRQGLGKAVSPKVVARLCPTEEKLQKCINMAGLKTWFKQNWVDIGSKRKDGSFAKCGRSKQRRIEEEVSKMRAPSESEIDDRRTEKICRCQETGSCQCGT